VSLFFCFTQHRLTGVRELRQQYAPNGWAFFAEPQRGGVAAPRGGGKRVDTCGFYPLVPLLGRQVRFTSQAENPASFLAKSPLSYFRKMCARAISAGFLMLFGMKLIFSKVLKRLCFYVCNPYNARMKRVIFV
jgi:hypothetical protein